MFPNVSNLQHLGWKRVFGSCSGYFEVFGAYPSFGTVLLKDFVCRSEDVGAVGVLWGVVDFGRRAELFDTSFSNDGDFVRHGKCVFRVVGDEDDGRFGAAEQSVDLVAE